MQDAKPGRKLAERTIDYGLAAMEYCETLPRTALWSACGRAFQQPLG